MVGNDYAWIGFIKKDCDTTCYWTDNHSVSYVNWHLGEPSGGGLFAPMIPDGCWGESSCASAFHSVCKYKR